MSCLRGGHRSEQRETVKDGLILRELTPSERERTRALYEMCFPEDDEAFVDYYYRNRAYHNRIYAAIVPETGQIVSMVHVNPVKVTGPAVKGEKLTIPYFVAVATDPAWRRRGLMRTLMEMAMADQEREGVPFGFLMPANEAYYTPLGFKRAWEWKWEDECLKEGQKCGEVKEADSLTDEELERIAGYVNKALASRFDLFAYRDTRYYRDLDLQQRSCGGKLLLETGDRQVQTEYMRCTFKEEFPPLMARILNVQRYDEQIGMPLKELNILISEVV